MVNILLIGISGVILILIAFILEEFKKNLNQVQYNLLNIVGASTLVYYSYLLQSWPFVILNVVWATVALIKLSRII